MFFMVPVLISIYNNGHFKRSAFYILAIWVQLLVVKLNIAIFDGAQCKLADC